MKVNEYKDSVGSLKLSGEFKQQLKERMLLEAQNRDETKEPKPDITVSVGKLSKKYSKYAALAACLLLAVSAAGVLAASQNALNIGTKADNAALENNSIEESTDANAEEEKVSMDYPEASNDDALLLESYSDDEEVDLPAAEDTNDELGSDIAKDNTAQDAPLPPVEVVTPRTGNGYSTDASRDYDGSYCGIDYVVDDVVGSARYNAVVVDRIDVNAKKISGSADVPAPAAPETPEYDVPTEAGEPFADIPVEGGAPLGNIHTESVDESASETDAPASVEGDVDSPTSEPSASYDNLTSLEGYGGSNSVGSVSFEDLTSGDSKEYYAIRDGVIAKLDNVGLIRFTIIEGYDSEAAIARNSSQISIDPTCQTLYRINVTYDYFNSEDANAERLLINTGNSRYQLIGRPAMEGEYIAVVTETESGVLTPVPELIYAVHKVRGLDIAYHLYSDNGFMVDPGSTNMGIMPEEVAVVNSTANNPEIYTQKAAVRELTFYLRRNILRMEPNVLDFSEKRRQEEDVNTPVEPEEEAPRELIRAVFPTGKLRLTRLDDSGEEVPAEVGKYTSDEVSGLRVNGIGIGDDMADARKAFFLMKYSFTPDARITLCASDDDGSWFVIVTFSENVVNKIEVFE